MAWSRQIVLQVLLIAGSLFLTLSNGLVTRSTISLPALPGPHSVGTISLEAIDYTRLDPYAPTPQPRALMTTLFYPTTSTKGALAPYLPTLLAQLADTIFNFPPGFLEQIQTPSYQSARLKEIPNIPILLFSPGLGSARESYTIMLESLASYGYLVVAMDHTYDAASVEFPDGSIILGLGISGDKKAIDTRVQDTSFIINQLLGNSTWTGQIPGVVHRDFSRSLVTMFGHSLGGSTTLQAMETDDRILGGVTLDGPFSGSELSVGTKKPFLLVGKENHTRFNDGSWMSVWNSLKGWKAELELKGSTHLSFSDEKAVFELLGVDALVDPRNVGYGIIEGVRANVVVVEYLRRFFDFVVGRGGDGGLEKTDKKFSEVSIV